MSLTLLFCVAALLFPNDFLESYGPTESSSVVENVNFTSVQIHINSPKKQIIHLTFYSLANQKIGTMEYTAMKGSSIIDITKMAFIQKHAYFEISMRSKAKLNSYKLVRR